MGVDLGGQDEDVLYQGVLQVSEQRIHVFKDRARYVEFRGNRDFVMQDPPIVTREVLKAYRARRLGSG